MNFTIYFLSINIISLFLCYFDKSCAILKYRRIPERVLLLFSFLGGAFGMVIGMHIFHHKTRKLKFLLVYVFCILWILGFYYYFNK